MTSCGVGQVRSSFGLSNARGSSLATGSVRELGADLRACASRDNIKKGPEEVAHAQTGNKVCDDLCH